MMSIVLQYSLVPRRHHTLCSSCGVVGFDLIGPYFPIESSMTSSVLQELIMLCLKALTSYGFKVSILLCDGASSNLTVLKLLSGSPKAQFPTNFDAETATRCERFYAKQPPVWLANNSKGVCRKS